jgi:suppressor of ftsI
MDRRRFLISSISVAAVATALGTDACSSGSGLSPSSLLPQAVGGKMRRNATRSVVLNVQYAITNISGYKLRGRTYNGKTYGPTISIRPGDTMSMDLVNLLPPNPPVTQGALRSGQIIPAPMDGMEAMNPMPNGPVKRSSNIDPMNNPHNFNTTNMHVHGIQTTPHLFQPVGTSDPMAKMIEVNPGEQYHYDFPIPKDHPSGLHWYHPHNHGSTDVQVSNGMAGLIVVRGPIDEVPEIKAARELFMTIQSLNVNGPNKAGIYDREYIAYRSKDNGGYAFGTQFSMYTVNGKGVYWVDNAKDTYKNLGTPTYTMQPGEVIRLRLLNGTNSLPLLLALPGFLVWQIGFDGVNTLKPILKDMSGAGTPVINAGNLRTAKMRQALPGNRIELLLQAPAKPGTYTLTSLASDGIAFGKVQAMNFMNFVVSGAPVTMGIPKTLPVPTREYPVITEAMVGNRKRKFVLDQGPRTDLLMGFGFTINNELYKMMECPTAPQVGTCEEWRIENATVEAHPFHLHENSFQLIKVNDQDNDMEIWDTFMVPPKYKGVNGSITFRVRFVQWYGKTVFHCHILPHEDTGMMQNILMV